MTKVRIIGGGLTGILAAFEAHRLGATQIRLQDALDRLGGWSLPRTMQGLELREGEFAFGSAHDPIRRSLEWQGVAFDEVDLYFGAVSPTSDGRRADWGEGPVLAARNPMGRSDGETLCDHLRAYPREAAEPLRRFCQWRLPLWLDQVHASAAAALALDRARLLGPGESPPPGFALRGAIPRDGLSGLFAASGRALARLGAQIELGVLVSPREAALDREPDEVIVWAADPTPLFDLAALPRPAAVAERVASYVFRADIAAPRPLTVRNFTAEGPVTQVRVYESRGETLVALECVDEANDAELRREATRLLSPFAERPPELGACLFANVRSRFACPTVEAVRGLARLKAELAQRHTGGFLVAGWESADAAARFAALSGEMQTALAGAGPASAVA